LLKRWINLFMPIKTSAFDIALATSCQMLRVRSPFRKNRE
jgi:hypothetical protein